MTTTMNHRLRPLGASALALTAVLAVGACSSSGSSSSSSGSSGAKAGGGTSANASVATKDAAAIKLLPASWQSKSALRVASDATYPPLESIATNGSTIVGADADLAQGIGQVLNKKVQLINAGFDTIIPALQSGKYDMGMSAFNDTKERQSAVDFVDYYRGGSSFFVKAQGGPTISGLADLCGKTVAVEKGTTQQDDATAQDKKCTSSGKSGVKLLTFGDQNATNLALSSGRAQVSIADSPVAAYEVKQSNGQFKLSGNEYGVVLHGIALPKGADAAKAIQAAVQSLIKQGIYAKIMKKWGIADNDTLTASAVTINGG